MRHQHPSPPPPALGPDQRALSNPERELLRRADQCVKCGYCLPHCPTYGLLRNEAESPRGRISLIQGLLWGDLRPSVRLATHLDNCLQCRACETACPSLVDFGSLMDGTRTLAHARRPRWRQALVAAVLNLLSDRRRLPLLVGLGRLYHSSGLARLAHPLGLLRRPRLAVLHRLSMSLQPPRRLLPAPTDQAVAGPRIDLFLGCIAAATQQASASAALRVLGRVGFQVQVRDGQGCCGAMQRHNGLSTAAQRQVEHNRRVFGNARVVGYASACVAELREHGGIDAVELCRLLVDTPWPPALLADAPPQRIAVHEPCSHRNVLRDTAAVYDLLARVPGLELVPLRGNETCCGAAGTYLLQHPVTARRLAANKIDHLRRLGVRTLVTTNTGCALHLAAEVQAAGLDVQVVHPIELIDRRMIQIEGQGPTTFNRLSEHERP